MFLTGVGQRKLSRWLIGLLTMIAIIAIIRLAPFPAEKLVPAPSTIVVDRNGELLRVFLSAQEMWQLPVTTDDISPTLKGAVIGYEDRYFRWHPGVNPVSLVRAAVANIRAGHVVQGGSTITMQVARMMEPKSRTIPNKLREIFRALQLELRYSKEEILKFYFNLAPYGGNIVGVGAAAHLYFNKKPQQLSLGECALLAAIPNSPRVLRPDFNFEATTIAREKVLLLLQQQNKVSRQQLAEALDEPLPQKRYAWPFLSPHLAAELIRNYPQHSRLETTIDSRLQRLAQSLLRSHLQPWRQHGISNGAVVIIDNQSREVLALVGSADFFDAGRQGQVNGALAPRSPGSALKPFLYALALDQGLVSPQTMLFDIPVEYAGYRPENYDGIYHGLVSVQAALALSLNVPAVNLSAQLGEEGIYSLLQEAGISTLPKPRDYYGLSLILGGCEVKLIELANLYAGLASGGHFRPYRVLTTQAIGSAKQLLSEGTCYIISEMLSHLRRPDLPAVWEHSLHLPKIAWKTGTSYGHRDAWSIGYNPQYTIGVWLGNFDGQGVPELVGADVAAPLLFSLFTALEQGKENKWFVQPRTVSRRQVCSISGLPLSDYCSSATTELYLPGISPNQPCTYHLPVWIDRASGRRLCSHCRTGRKYDEKIVVQWPAAIATWMERNGFPVEKIPEHFPRCPKIAAGEKPVILSPPANAEYRIRPGVKLKYQQILLDASVSNHTQKIYWFLDGKLIASGSPTQKVFITPRLGSHQVLCLDDEGRSSEVKFAVK
jgi:penicillin-binding protein 1C